MSSQPIISPPAPFQISFPKEEMDDLRRRLGTARWPEREIVPESEEDQATSFGLGWGVTLPLMKQLVEEWKDYSFEEEIERMNAVPHFKTQIEDLSIHFIHQKSRDPKAIPLILIHGWPDSSAEFIPVISRLVNPPAGQQAFHVVVPDQPGFAFSSAPQTSKWMMDDTARVFDKLMRGLGYQKYAAQGGDWGSIAARALGALYPRSCKAVHLNFCPATGSGGFLSMFPQRTMIEWAPSLILSKKEKKFALRSLEYQEKGSAYYWMQHFTPRTPAYALNDSPVGTLAWIAEKILPSISEATALRPNNATLTKDTLFGICSLYWLTKSMGTSFLPYTLNPHFLTFLDNNPRYYLPNFAFSAFPNEIALTPMMFVRKTGRLRWFKEAESGGHWAPVEEPETFAEHVSQALAAIWPASKL
ncbi:epoxide hydrolase [Meredithblackwellia eburnea MCA 4105]